jgi:WD40 repeat protein
MTIKLLFVLFLLLPITIDDGVTSSINTKWSLNAPGGVEETRISSDGRYCAVSFNNSTFALFGVETGKKIWSYGPVYPKIMNIDISDNGERSVMCCSGIVYCFNNISGEPLWTTDLSDGLYTLKITGDGNHIVAGGDNKILYLLNAINGKEIWNYSLLDNPLYYEQLSISDSANLIAASCETKVYLFSKDSSVPFKIIEGYGRITDVVVAKDGSSIAFSSYKHKLNIFDSKGTLLNSKPIGGELGIAISDDGKLIITCNYISPKLSLLLYSNSDGKVLWNSPINGTHLINLDISGDGKIIASGDENGQLRLYSMYSGKFLKELKLGDMIAGDSSKNSITLDYDGTTCVVGTYQGASENGGYPDSKLICLNINVAYTPPTTQSPGQTSTSQSPNGVPSYPLEAIVAGIVLSIIISLFIKKTHIHVLL